MNIKEIVSDTKHKELRVAVRELSAKNEVTIAQAYSGVVGRVREEFPNYEPYKSFPSFYEVYKRQNRKEAKGKL